MPDRIVPVDEQKLLGSTPEIRALEYELRRYPPLLSFVQNVARDHALYDHKGITSISDLMGDRAVHAMFLLLGDHAEGVWRTDEMRLYAAQAVLDAVPVLWPTAMWEAARALPLPAHVVSPDVMPYPLMWWRFAQARGQQSEIESVLLCTTEEGLEVIIYGSPGERGQVAFSGHFSIPFLARFPDDLDDNAEVVLQMLAFMNSRYVDADAVLPDRAERRRITHAGLSEPSLSADHPAHVIRLRAPEPEGGSAGLGGTRAWSHRWFVRGHYRAQWYPSLQAHRVRWIAAYVKGPGDKPIALPAVEVRQ